MKIKKLLLFFIIIFSMISSFFFISYTKAESDIIFTFDKDIFYNESTIDFEGFNLRYQQEYTKLYNASYSFTNEIDGSIPLGWTFINNTDIFGQVISNISGHSKVYKIFDGSNVNDIDSRTFFSEVSGTYEFWFRTNDTTENCFIYGINQAESTSIRTYISNGYFGVIPGGGGATNLASILDNTWYHLRFDFESGGGSYEGLTPDTFFWYINGIKFGAYNFFSVAESIDNFKILTSGSIDDFNIYLDGFGLSWFDNYTIGKNLLPYLKKSKTITEVDKCDFAYNLTTFEPNILGALTIDNNWIENDDDTNTHVQTAGIRHRISIDYGPSQNQDYYGIYKEFSYNNDNIFNISFDINSMDLWNPHLDGWYFNIYSFDDTLLVSLLFNSTIPLDISLYYYDGSSYILIHSDIPNSFSLNIFIYDFVILTLNDDNWYFSELTSNIGINTIEVIGGHADDIGNLANIQIDSIGLYINGSSYLPDDLSSIIIETNIEQWDDSIHNLFEITGNGNFSFSVFYDGSFMDTIIPFSEFNNESKRIHYIEGNIFEGSGHYTFVCISDTSFTISEICIYTVSLREGSNTYIASFISQNIDGNESYFYVSNNRLYFDLITDDENVEYIIAQFNINDISSLGLRISFRSKIDNNAKGLFIINYSSTYTSFPLNLYQSFTSIILSQGKIITNFMIIITDFDDNNIIGITSGFIDSIKLLFLDNIQITIISLSLIGMIVPLIIILTPTLALRELYGESFVIPVFLLMSLILTIGEILPIWLFFIIAISSSLFITKKT